MNTASSPAEPCCSSPVESPRAQVNVAVPDCDTGAMPLIRRLNIGSGRDFRETWYNLDRSAHPRFRAGIDLVLDLEFPPYCHWNKSYYAPIPDDYFSAGEMAHCIEHLHKPLPVMEELHRIMEPNAKLVVSCPYGSSDDAFEDPTHYRQYFIMSWYYFSQNAYHKADYGYRGDWELEQLTLKVHGSKVRGMKHEEILRTIYRDRNIVAEQIATLRCIKPIRQPDPHARWTRPPIKIELI